MSIPRTELAPAYTVSRIQKGGWQLAGGHGAIDRNAALDDMARFVDAGITTFDCADIYTGVEELIGEFLRGRRGQGVQVHTKYVPDLDALATLTRRDVEAAIDRSLSRLGVDHLDLVQFHWWSYAVARYVDVAGWLNDLRLAGKIAHLGATNCDAIRLHEIIGAGVPLVAHQVQYSVLDRRPAAPEYSAAGMKLLCYGGVAGGFLSDRYLDRPDPTAPLENRSLVKYRLIIDEFGGWEALQRMLRVLSGIAACHRTSISAVALRWVMDQPSVAGVIVGARHARHLADLQQAASLTLTPEDVAAIAEVHRFAPGPAGAVYGLERSPGGVHGAVMRYTLNAGIR